MTRIRSVSVSADRIEGVELDEITAVAPKNAVFQYPLIGSRGWNWAKTRAICITVNVSVSADRIEGVEPLAMLQCHQQAVPFQYPLIGSRGWNVFCARMVRSG